MKTLVGRCLLVLAALTATSGRARAAELPADTTPRSVSRSSAREARWTPTGLSVMELAWSGSGAPGLLHVVAAGVETGLGGLSGRLEMLAKWGHDGVAFPSSQGLSSLDAGDFAGLGEAWLEWEAGESFRLKAGRVDGNTEFAASEVAGTFANPSFGLTPALGFLPSYPAPAPSANLFVGPGVPGSQLGVGVYRGAAGWSVLAQAAAPVPGLPSVRWAAGWGTPLERGPTASEAAAYVIVERPSPGASVFLKAAGSGELRHLAAGVTARPGRAREVLVGLAASAVARRSGGGEAVAEAFVAIRALRWLEVQPDAQLLLAPGEAPRAAGLVRVVVER